MATMTQLSPSQQPPVDLAPIHSPPYQNLVGAALQLSSGSSGSSTSTSHSHSRDALRSAAAVTATSAVETDPDSSSSDDVDDLDDSGDNDNDRELKSIREVDAESIIAPVISRTQSNALYAAAAVSPVLSSRNDDDTTIKSGSGMLEVRPRAAASVDRKDRIPPIAEKPAAETQASIATAVRPLVAGPAPEDLGKPSRPGFAYHKRSKSQQKKSSLSSFSLPSLQLPSLSNLSLPSFGEKEKGKTNKLKSDRQRSKTLNMPRPSSAFFSGPPKALASDKPAAEEEDTGSKPPVLRRVSSVSSLPTTRPALSRAPSAVSSINDDSKYMHIRSQTNSRFKAIKDNFLDTLPQLPQLPQLQQQLASLNPFSDPSAVPSTPTKDGFRQSPALDALDTVTGDVVVLGGYRGSILRDKSTNRRVWIPLKVGFNLRKIDLEVGLEAEDDERMAEKIVPDGMLSHIGPVDISRRLLRRLRTNPEEQGRKVYDWGYDWRLSPALISKRLIEFLEKLPCNQVREGEDPKERRKGKGALVIAHSLGGLIVRHAVNQRPELFSGVLFAGTPMHCVNILGPLRNGDSVLFNSKVFTAQVNFTLRSSYAFLPDDGHCFIDRRTGQPIPLDFFNAQTWQDFALSPCVATSPILPAPSFPRIPLPALQSATFPVRNRKENQNTTTSTFSRFESEASRDRTLAPQLGSSSLSLFAETQVSTLPLDKAVSYLQRTLDETKRFRQELQWKEELREKYPPFAVVYSKTTPTVTGARVDGKEAIRRADVYDDLAFGAGDGVCLARAAMLPHGYECVKKVAVDRGHVSLLGDLEGVGSCLQAIVEQRGW